MAAKRLSIRLTPSQVMKLEELRSEGLDPGVKPRTANEVIVDALMLLHRRRVATGRQDVMTVERKFDGLEITEETLIPEDEPYNAQATPEHIAHVTAMLNNAKIVEVNEALDDTEDVSVG